MNQSRPVGAEWLVEKFGIQMVQPLVVRSQIGTGRRTQVIDGHRLETYPPGFYPGEAITDHLGFTLKHEGVALELLARVFKRVDPQDLSGWIASEPTGQYAKRACFLYEWITGKKLLIADGLAGGNYVDALSGDDMVVATNPQNNPRWRVRDNMPGTRDFCPVVRRTPSVLQATTLDLKALLAEQEAEFGAEVLRRSAVWLTLRESRSSFLIEGEQKNEDRIQRFARVMETQTGKGNVPLDGPTLARLQEAILGSTTTLQNFGLRQSPVFVGQSVRYENIVHYVAPPHDALPSMMKGLQAFVTRTAGASSAVRAAVASFGFIYIHPLADGNGRVHRFLINDMLRRDGAVPEPFILPVSALITERAKERAAYDQSLEAFSRPFMERFGASVSFSREPVAQRDGVLSNFNFSDDEEAMLAWRFMDLTSHVEYLGNALESTIRQELHAQASFFRSHDLARQFLSKVIEGPDPDLDRIIRSIRQNDGLLTNKLRFIFPALGKEGVWEQAVDAVRKAFGEDLDDGNSSVDAPAAAPIG